MSSQKRNLLYLQTIENTRIILDTIGKLHIQYNDSGRGSTSIRHFIRDRLPILRYHNPSLHITCQVHRRHVNTIPLKTTRKALQAQLQQQSTLTQHTTTSTSTPSTINNTTPSSSSSSSSIPSTSTSSHLNKQADLPIPQIIVYTRNNITTPVSNLLGNDYTSDSDILRQLLSIDGKPAEFIQLGSIDYQTQSGSQRRQQSQQQQRQQPGQQEIDTTEFLQRFQEAAGVMAQQTPSSKES